MNLGKCAIKFQFNDSQGEPTVSHNPADIFTITLRDYWKWKSYFKIDLHPVKSCALCLDSVTFACGLRAAVIKRSQVVKVVSGEDEPMIEWNPKCSP